MASPGLIQFRHERIEELRQLAGGRPLSGFIRTHVDRLFSGVTRKSVLDLATKLGRAEVQMGAATHGSKEWDTASARYQSAIIELTELLDRVGVAAS